MDSSLQALDPDKGDFVSESKNDVKELKIDMEAETGAPSDAEKRWKRAPIECCMPK